jgi:PAS domain S-box-containing protein
MLRLFRKGGIRVKLIFLVFLPTVIILFWIAVYAYLAYQQLTQDLLIQRHTEKNFYYTQQIADYIDYYNELLTSEAWILANYQGDFAAQQTELKNAADRLFVFDSGVLVLDVSGTVIITEPEQPDLIGSDWSDRPFYSHIQQSSRLEFSNILSGGPAGEEIIAVAVPITNDNDELIGILAGMFREGETVYSDLYGEMNKLRMGKAYIVDGNGRIIFHYDPDYLGTAISDQAIVQQVEAGQRGHLHIFDEDEQEILVSINPVPGTQWGLVTQQTWKTLTDLTSRNSRQLLGLLVIGTVVSGGLMYILVDRFLKPIRELNKGAQLIADGDFGHTITASTNDEIEDLANQFNLMSQTLQQNRERLLEAHRIARLGHWVRDIPKNEVWWSEEIYRMTGRTRREWGSGSLEAFLDIVHPDDRDNVVQAIQVAIREHKPYSIDHRFIHPDGTECLVHEQGEVTYDESGEAIQITGTVQDITKRKQIEAELEKHRHQLENLVAERTAELNQEIAQRIEIQEALRQSELEKAITEERSRLARDLHDSVTQSLHSSTLLAEAGQRLASSGDVERARGYLIRLGDISQQALKEMRLLVYELRPIALRESGLVGALQQRLDNVERRAGVEVQLFLEEEIVLPTSVEEELFRIAMEALNNAMKHANPTTVKVVLRIEEKREIPCVELEIIDDGIGFDLDTKDDEGGLGLLSMKERIEKLGGELTILSAIGEGTQLKACVELEPYSSSPDPREV